MNDTHQTEQLSHAAEPDAEPPKNRSFFFLMLSGFISMLGDQFTLIGLPWLTLKVTGDPLSLGLVLAVVGIPRAVFVLLGGAFVDKYSPKAVLLVSKYISSILLGMLAILIYQTMLTLPLLYLLAAAIGLASAFAHPAGTSILPFVVPREKLQQANGLMMGMRQLTFFLGPLLAGLVITGFGSERNDGAVFIEDTVGLALVFALDAMSFLLSAFTLYKVTARRRVVAEESTRGAWKLMIDGIRAVAADRELKSIFLYMALIQVFVVGPMQVGLPVLSESRLDGGAASFGTIMAAHGLGILTGVVLSGAGVSLGFRTLGWMILCVDLVIGFAVAGFGFVSSTLVGAATLFSVGILGGLVQVKVFSWLQQRTCEVQMGRVMSFFMFIVMGIAPVAASAGGWLLASTNVTGFFVGCGISMIVIALSTMLVPEMRDVGLFAAPSGSHEP